MNALEQPTSVLLRLIQEGEQILQRRRIDGGAMLELEIAVDRLLMRPTDQKRVVDDHTLIYARAAALAGKHLAEFRPELARRYMLVVAVLIDTIRDDWAEALAQSKRPAP